MLLTDTGQGLTSCRLVAVVSVSEVLRVLHHGDAGHPDDNSIWTRVQGAGGDNAVVDVMQGAGGVFLTADHGHRTCNQTRGDDWTSGSTWTAT